MTDLDIPTQFFLNERFVSKVRDNIFKNYGTDKRKQKRF